MKFLVRRLPTQQHQHQHQQTPPCCPRTGDCGISRVFTYEI